MVSLKSVKRTQEEPTPSVAEEAKAETPIAGMTGVSDAEAESVMEGWLAEGAPVESHETDDIAEVTESVLKEVEEARKSKEKKQAEKIEKLCATLNKGQKEAVGAIMAKKTGMILVEGHAGTGKSYVLKVVLEMLWQEKRKVCLAPTHQALDQITDLSEDKGMFSTVASFFGVTSTMDKDSGEDKFSDPNIKGEIYAGGGYIFADECFMYGDKEGRLFEKLSETSRVVFFGDSAQLPPVNKEAYDFHTHVPEHIELTEQMRNGDMVLFLCNHFRKSTRVPQTSKGNVVVHDYRPDMVKEFIEAIKKDPIPGDISYIAFTNKQMRKVRSDVRKYIYDGEDYPEGQWLRLEVNDEMIGRGGQLQAKRRNLVGKIIESDTTSLNLMGREWNAYLLRLEDMDGKVLKHSLPKSEIGRKLIPDDTEWFLTLSFDDLDELDQLMKKQFNENRKNARAAKMGSTQAKAAHKQGVLWAQEAQKLTKALSPYALTAHKSQGMSINHVFLDAGNILQYQNMPNHPTKELLYVGASRTRSTLHISV